MKTIIVAALLALASSAWGQQGQVLSTARRGQRRTARLEGNDRGAETVHRREPGRGAWREVAEGREMTGEECREARERLNWTRLELATAASVPLWFIAALEDGRSTPDFLVAYEIELRAALEAAGVEAKGRA